MDGRRRAAIKFATVRGDSETVTVANPTFIHWLGVSGARLSAIIDQKWGARRSSTSPAPSSQRKRMAHWQMTGL
jgi:hypothetical protein